MKVAAVAVPRTQSSSSPAIVVFFTNSNRIVVAHEVSQNHVDVIEYTMPDANQAAFVGKFSHAKSPK